MFGPGLVIVRLCAAAEATKLKASAMALESIVGDFLKQRSTERTGTSHRVQWRSLNFSYMNTFPFTASREFTFGSSLLILFYVAHP